MVKLFPSMCEALGFSLHEVVMGNGESVQSPEMSGAGLRCHLWPGVLAEVCSLSSWEAEARGSGFQLARCELKPASVT